MLVLGLAACGDSDDDAAQTPSTTSTAAAAAAAADEQADDRASSVKPDAKEKTTPADEPAPEPAPSDEASPSAGGQAAPPSSGDDEEARVAAAVTEMYDAFADGDARGVCGAMSTSARQEAATGTPAPEGAGKPTTCVGALATFFAAAAETGALNTDIKATVEDVAVDGDTAIATVTISGRKGKIRVVKESGDWRFGKLPTSSG